MHLWKEGSKCGPYPQRMANHRESRTRPFLNELLEISKEEKENRNTKTQLGRKKEESISPRQWQLRILLDGKLVSVENILVDQNRRKRPTIELSHWTAQQQWAHFPQTTHVEDGKILWEKEEESAQQHPEV